MSHRTMIEWKRRAAGAMGILMLVVVLFSSFYIAVEAGHDCSGHDCPICTVLHQCERVLHETGSGLITAAAVILPSVIMMSLVFSVVPMLVPVTPVRNKVRMDN